MKNKIIAFISALAILLQCGAFTTVNANADNELNKTVELLIALGVMDVDEYTGFFWDETPVRRNEMAEILCKLMRDDIKLADTAVFSDVSHADRGFIETAVQNGYMNGCGNNLFQPNSYVTYEQVAKILVCLLGGEQAAEAIGGYPSGYTQLAQRLGIMKGVAYRSDYIRRIDVAKAIYNAIHADVFEISSIVGNSLQYSPSDRSFLNEEMDIYILDGIVEQNEATGLRRPEGLSNCRVKINNEIFYDTDDLLYNYLGCSVTVYYRYDEISETKTIVHVEEDRKNEILVIDDMDLVRNSVTESNIEYYSNNRKKDAELAVVKDMLYNGKSIDFDINKVKNISYGNIRLVDNNGDEKFDLIDIKDYRTFIINGVTKDDLKIVPEYGESVVVTEDNSVRVFKNGEKIDITHLKKGDVVLAAISENTSGDKAIEIRSTDKTFFGAVKYYHQEDDLSTVEIDGVEYVVNPYYNRLVARGYTEEIKSGLSGEFFLDDHGGIVYSKTQSVGKQMGYLIKTFVREDSYDYEIIMRLRTDDGKIRKYKGIEKVRINGKKKNLEDVYEDSELLSKLNTPQLIKFKVEDDILTEIELAENGYESIKFSLDVSGRLLATATGILDDKYCLTDDTIIYYVPNTTSENSSILLDEGKYRTLSKDFFAVNTSYNIDLYDIDSLGRVGYAVFKYNYTPGASTFIGEGEGFMIVSDVTIKLDEYDEICYAVKGYNHGGAEVEYLTSNKDVLTGKVMKTKEDTDGELVRYSEETSTVKEGDVIQYHRDSLGYLDEVMIHHRMEDTEMYNPVNLISSEKCKTRVMFGQIMQKDSTSALLTSQTHIPSYFTPSDADKYIGNSGSAIYRCEGKEVEKISFDDLECGDKLFVCTTGVNANRIIVVYE